MKRTATTLAVVAMLAMAGCVGSIPGLGGGGDDGETSRADPVEHVPGDVDAVLTVDAAVADDQNTRDVLNTLFEEGNNAPGDPQSVDEAVDQLQREVNANLTQNLSLDEIDGVAAFGTTPDNPEEAESVDESERYAGVILSVGWAREDVLTNVRDEATVTESEYSGVTIYEFVNESAETPVYAAEYRTGLWAFSANKAVVEDVIDVAQGEADSFDGDLRTAFDNTREDAYVRYATTVSNEQRRLISRFAAFYGASVPADLTRLGDVTAVAGDYYSQGDQVGVSTYLTATNQSAAEGLNETLGALIRVGKSSVDDQSAREQLDALSTEQNGETISIVYEIDVSTLQELIREESSSPSGAVAPAPSVVVRSVEAAG